MAIRRCHDVRSLNEILAACRAEQAEALFLFFGSEEPHSGESWCPDCVIADPLLRAACGRLRPEVTLYECPVGPREDWKQRPDHPYRRHPVFRLDRIPTLVHLRGHCELGRLVEADCTDEMRITHFLGGV